MASAVARRVIAQLGQLAPLGALARGVLDPDGAPEPFRIVPFFEGSAANGR